MNEIWIVGDRFGAFAGHDGVLTLTGFVRGLTAIAAGRDLLRVRLGQGIGEHERAYLTEAIERHGLRDRVRVAESRPTAAGRDLVHKHRLTNVLLEDVREADGDRFHAGLRVASDNELLLDHESGGHVPGIVVVEAARQMILAAMELRYFRRLREEGHRGEWAMVWDDVEVRFASFLFPLPAEVHCELVDPAPARMMADRVRCTARIVIVQAGREAATALITCTAFGADRLAAVEHRRGLRAVAEISTGPDDASTGLAA
ncbi:AfsA-related hotdog domain-containing protein [Actinoplanes sp. NEAU-A12]|uniref:AfsA-related hotdog domain-containing protein n=1 Tax=Actinoplanes sandaracinus TaxID=3045177 RepID=A0ABT6WL33_9ACTN|nr:AfsA-related hotdog domain-containing protein [Actinoplanes sandaracinus]MDI6100396.1 AfsA-related hotdog domain-containing protein [Actinoplanes sandaracinus]